MRSVGSTKLLKPCSLSFEKRTSAALAVDSLVPDFEQRNGTSQRDAPLYALQIGLIHKILRFEADFRADQQFAKLLRDVAIDLDGWGDSGPSEPMHGTRLVTQSVYGSNGNAEMGDPIRDPKPQPPPRL